MKIDKVNVCMKGVDAVKEVARNIGMVCKNCDSYDEHSGFCYWMINTRDIPAYGFCHHFEFRDENACAQLWDKCMDKLGIEDAEIQG